MSGKLILLKNTILLYVLTFSTYLINFILIPYETRVLKPDAFGLLGICTAAMAYFQLIIDFGFMLSATEEVSLNRENKRTLSIIFTTVTINKIFLIALSGISLIALCNVIPSWKCNMTFFILMFAATSINSLIPDYLYRGIENMGAITFRTVIIKLLFAMLVFIFVKKPEDYIKISIINIIGNSAALIGVYFHLLRKINVHFVKINVSDAFSRLKASAVFFLSRIATTVYTVSNTIILGMISGNSAAAYYTSADKLVSTAKSGLSPIADSLYPYMIKNHDYRIVKILLAIFEPLIIIACITLFIFAEPLCVWFFGDEYRNSAYALRSLLPIVIFTFPNYILGFPVLGSMGQSKHANYSIIFASSIHIINLIVLYFSGHLNMITLGIAASVAEGLILLYRSIIIVKYVKSN